MHIWCGPYMLCGFAHNITTEPLISVSVGHWDTHCCIHHNTTYTGGHQHAYTDENMTCHWILLTTCAMPQRVGWWTFKVYLYPSNILYNYLPGTCIGETTCSLYDWPHTLWVTSYSMTITSYSIRLTSYAMTITSYSTTDVILFSQHHTVWL